MLNPHICFEPTGAMWRGHRRAASPAFGANNDWVACSGYRGVNLFFRLVE
jgi:hypothetical protein